ncbi:innexin unc-9-like [Ostrea edulis]|uniref:innexin unc-9-like n=1 Tax=Ostrea edulis TaxID=37623 RepID=UPI002094C06D|nr:innexin unc-9-like [Ostrea edulis]
MDSKIAFKLGRVAGGEKTGDFTYNLRPFGHGHDDWIDRLNNIIVPFFLVVFAVYIGTEYLFSGPPIHCWCPAEFTDTHVDYVHHFCWIRNTYYVPLTQPIVEEARKNEEVVYYQWVSIILLFMALMFKLPSVFWRLFYKDSGIQIDTISQTAAQSQCMSWDERNQTVKNIACDFQRWARVRAPRQRGLKYLKSLFSKRSGSYIVSLYFVQKCLYCANTIGQFFLLDAFLGHDFYLQYGTDFFSGSVGNSTMGLARFPRVTMCDFNVRQLQNLPRWTVQCVLPLNMYNEKIFVFLWILYALVAFLTSANLLLWIWRLMIHRNRVAYIQKFLMNCEGKTKDPTKEKHIQSFIQKQLHLDGIFVLRIAERNTGAVFIMDLVQELWAVFDKRYETR